MRARVARFPPHRRAILRLVKESILLWISYVAIVFIAFFFLAMPVMPVQLVLAFARPLAQSRHVYSELKIPAAHRLTWRCRVNFESDELQRYKFKSDQDLVIGIEKGKAYSNPLIRVEGAEAVRLDS